MKFYDGRQGDGGFEAGIRHGLTAHARRPRVPVSRRAGAADVAAGDRTASAISSSPRASRSSSGAACRTRSCCSAAAQRRAARSRKCWPRRCGACSRTRAPRRSRPTSRFQWLNMAKLGEIQPDVAHLPDAERRHARGLPGRAALFIDSVFRENRSVLDLLSANYTFLNERLALLYGITDVKGDQFRRVQLTRLAALRPARQGRDADGHLLPEPHGAGAARRVHARAPHGHAAGGAAAERRQR